jgi:hypothetical protein
MGPAPADLDGLLHYLWQGYEAGGDDQIAEAARNLHAAVDGDALAEVRDGTLTDLTAEEAGLVGRTDTDVTLAQGMYLVRTFPCTLADLDPLLYDLHQDALHPGSYDSYERAYTSSLADYEAREEPWLSWHVDYATSILGTSYTAALEGGLRWVPDLGAEASPWGPLLVARTWMPEAAVMEEGSSKSLSQDFQIELFYERVPGELLHAYGLWREAGFGALGTTADEGVQRVILNALSDWDDETAGLCAER